MPGAHCSKYSTESESWEVSRTHEGFQSGKEPGVYSEDRWRALKGLEQGSDTLQVGSLADHLAAGGDSGVNGLISPLEMAVVQTQIAAVGEDSWGDRCEKELRMNRRDVVID